MRHTGVFATAEEMQEMKDAAGRPLIALNAGMPESPQKACHRIALSRGLPEVQGYYGCDLRTGEFLAEG